jgi:hypothetical protein
MKAELYSDAVYEKSIAARLEKSKQLMQELVNSWSALGLRGCSSSGELFEMVNNPRMIVREAQELKRNDTQGLSASEVTTHQQNLKFVNPHSFYLKSDEVKQDSYSQRVLELFTLKDGKVILQKAGAQSLIKSKSVFAVNEQQKEVGENVLKVQELFNNLNRATQGGFGEHFSDLLSKSARPNSHGDPQALNLEVFKAILASA